MSILDLDENDYNVTDWWYSDEPIVYPDYTEEEKAMVVQMMRDEVFPNGDLLKHTDGLKRLLDNLDTEEAKERYVMSTTLSMPLEDLKKEKFVPSKWLVAHECEVIKQWRIKINK